MAPLLEGMGASYPVDDFFFLKGFAMARNGAPLAYIPDLIAELFQMFFALDHCRFLSTQTICMSTR